MKNANDSRPKMPERRGRRPRGGESEPAGTAPRRAALRLLDAVLRRGELHRLSARRGAQVEHRPAIALTKQTGRDAGGKILHPPAAIAEAGQVFDRAAPRQPIMARRERAGFGPSIGVGLGSEAQVDRGRCAPAMFGRGNRLGAPRIVPARRRRGRQARALG